VRRANYDGPDFANEHLVYLLRGAALITWQSGPNHEFVDNTNVSELKLMLTRSSTILSKRLMISGCSCSHSELRKMLAVQFRRNQVIF
jgi:hypothetical protein